MNTYPHQNPQWSPEDVETLKRMMEEGASAREIGGAVKRSRNAVLGYIHRNFRKGFIRKSAPRKPRAVVKDRPKPPPLERKPKPSRVRENLYQESLFPVFLSPGNTRRLFEISRTQCRYVMNTEINPLVCGEPTHEGTSWCSCHHSLVFLKRKAKVK